ncbi:MAG TPA: RNA 2',3'-cyclic phosphodiesterase [Anaerolineaceae bacterium]|nr:RNA 2',3'-cyclic phosphodiesterase [Anaerolineaceae bacterium]
MRERFFIDSLFKSLYTDSQIMEMIRSFIAVELTTPIQSAMGRVIKQLSPATNVVRWVPPQNIHLTFKFLGDIELSGVAKLQDSIKKECRQYLPFEIHIGTLGAFPNSRQPRVIWIGVQAPPDLAALQKGIDSALSTLGYPVEGRPFSPHLTLGRVSQHASREEVITLASLIARTTVGDLGASRVEAVTLFRSDLRPTGSIYTALYKANLSSG